MQIEIDKYISEEEKRWIAIEEWRKMVREACKGNAERIMGNIAHDVVGKMVDEALGENANRIIADKAIAVIDELSVYSVFRRADAWDRAESPAYKALMDAVVANADIVNDRVRAAIRNISKKEALEVLKSGVIQINPHLTERED